MPRSCRKVFLGCCKIHAFFFTLVPSLPVGAQKWYVEIQLRAVHSTENSEVPSVKIGKKGLSLDLFQDEEKADY